MTDKFLFCGLGSIGTRHLNNLHLLLPKAELLAYRTKIKRGPFRDAKLAIKEFFSLEQALKAKPTAVFITNPTAYHLTTAIKASKYNCHLFIEKPLATNTKGVDKLIRLVKQKKLVAFLAYVLRFHPQIKQIKKIIEEEKLGRIYLVQAYFSSYLPAWHPWESYQQMYSGKQKLGGGVLLDASHELDYLYWFFGKVHWLQAWLGKLSNLAIDVEDTALITLKFVNKIVAEIHLDYLGQPAQRKLIIIGEKGTLAWDFFASKLSLYDAKRKKWHTIPKSPSSKSSFYNKMYLAELKHFLECLKTKKKPLITLKDGLYVLRIIEAVRKSNKEEKRIYL